MATKVLDIVMQLPTDFDWVDCSEDFTDDQAKAILELLDRPILALRRLRASLSARGNGYTCDNCGDVFQAARSDARFCSSACRQAEHRKTARPGAASVV